ncbi:ABC transporter ATP-binding protein [Asaia sp. As-1742]|uniref:ABC transporter ATP-binding protein n=1 Tax=Asaia sp. As-1742 TaxID=2608325 RepID=UPI00142390E1|nr:TOBE domain-containing protein [Asaia sp. As-1742]NIE79524.1 TOBE domain-containing protein [Asaia sp. As-1742]
MSGSSREHQPPLSIHALSMTAGAPGFSLELGRGEAISLLSETTDQLGLFCDVLSGFAAPASGCVMINGEPILEEPPERRDIALVSAREPVFGHMDVADNIAFSLRVRGMPLHEMNAIVSNRLALLGLDAFSSTRADSLSPEYDLRLRLARALAFNPSVLVLDDILSGLDLRAIIRTRQLITKLHRALGLTLLYTANSREDAVWLGGRIALFDKLTLVQCANASILLDRPATPWVASLFAEANLLVGRTLTIEDDVATVHLASGGIVEALADADLEEDSLCVLCIRPDRITPLFSTSVLDDDGPQPLVATLQSVLNTGEQMRLRLRLSDGVEIEMRRPLLQSGRHLAPGTPMQLAWQASQAVAFPMKDDL